MTKSISSIFSGVGAKRLSQVEIMKSKSNQHEFNGVNGFREILGSEKLVFDGTFIYLDDEPERCLRAKGSLTWYDSRDNQPHRSAEFRLYYTENEIVLSSLPGDLVVVARTTGSELMIVFAKRGSTSEKQLLWLFGLNEVDNKFVFREFASSTKDIGFAGRYIINTLGIEIEEELPNYLELMFSRFGKMFPSTQAFSSFARETVKDVSPKVEPDQALMLWLRQEEMLFRTFEKYLVQEKLTEGFGNDVDEFISYSLSIQNRRKARAGRAFENHLETLFVLNELQYSKGPVTENNNRPDFLFPGGAEYSNPTYDSDLLTMLGVKTTAKDRWRQVLSEADRITQKHLITLEPAISKNQTDEMKARNLQLIIPHELISTYSSAQVSQILSLKDFIELVRMKQPKPKPRLFL